MNGTNAAQSLNKSDRQKLIRGLLVALLLQIGLAVFLSNRQEQYAPQISTSALIPDAVAARKIEITESPEDSTKPKKSLILQSKNNTWFLPAQSMFPVPVSKSNPLIDALTNLKRGLAVSSTGEAPERFKVSENNYLKKVTLFDSNAKELGTLYIGVSSQPGHVYVRWSKDNAIYSSNFPQDLLNTSPMSWAETELIKVVRAHVKSIELPNYTLTKNKPGWTLISAGKQHAVPASVVNNLLDRLESMPVKDILGNQDLPTYNSNHPELVCKITTGLGRTFTYTWSKLNNSQDYVLKRSDVPFYFGQNAIFATQLKALTAQEMLDFGKSGNNKADKVEQIRDQVQEKIKEQILLKLKEQQAK